MRIEVVPGGCDDEVDVRVLLGYPGQAGSVSSRGEGRVSIDSGQTVKLSRDRSETVDSERQ